MDEKYKIIRQWLKTGSINIFGLPMSGKDTVGIRLAKEIDGRFLSSGDIIRDFEVKHNDHMTKNGELIPTNKFYDIVLPFFSSQELAGFPLVLSSIGRWSGEEDAVMKYTKEANHEIKAVIYLQLTEKEVRQRWQKAKELGDRGERSDDNDPLVFETRITEFYEKTIPVLEHYDRLSKLITIPATGTRDEVFGEVINGLINFLEK